MNKDICKELKKQSINTPENFYKLLMFVICMAGEGIEQGTCAADDLVYGDILKDASLDWEKLNNAAEEFTTNYKGTGND